MKKQYAVLGLGVFGSTIATTLAKHGCEVLAVDRDVSCVERVAGEVTKAVVANVTHKEELIQLGLPEFDVAVVAIGDHLEDAVLATMALKELGVPMVIAKARNKEFLRILEKVGADRVIRAEKDMGIRVAKSLMRRKIKDIVELDDENSIVEIQTAQRWVGKAIADLNVREKYQMNILGIRHNKNECLEIGVDPSYIIQENDRFLVLARTDKLEQFDRSK